MSMSLLFVNSSTYALFHVFHVYTAEYNISLIASKSNVFSFLGLAAAGVKQSLQSSMT